MGSKHGGLESDRWLVHAWMGGQLFRCPPILEGRDELVTGPGPSMEQRARSRMYFIMASIAFSVLAISGIAIAVMGNGAGWLLVAIAVVLWAGLYLTLTYTQKSQP
ncbi:hypothetical protein E4U92_07290 [Streptomyces galbus]|uniref:Uncharacterized protein n=1 Tax=Streptomyces galbus TaxID=33898 RepID=A0A4U5X732_STRGB|nr:hypothetical protein E4U92_07290 [Streptomyces galbus]